jgi:hypothetical protein
MDVAHEQKFWRDRAGGGALFLVMDQDLWSTLEQTKVNDLIRPFGSQFGAESPDSLAGGHTNAGLLTEKSVKLSYHGAAGHNRLVVPRRTTTDLIRATLPPRVSAGRSL